MSHEAAIAEALRELATAEGFSAVGFAAVAPLEVEGGRLERWLADGFHADMDWMARSLPERLDPRRLLPGAATVAVMALPCTPPRPPDPGGLTGQVARYAWGRDYHNVLGKRLRRIQRALAQRFPGLGSYASVDSRPVFERAWAVRAGVGFSGRSTHQVVPGTGPGVLLATLVLDAALPPTGPHAAGCGTCARCLRACPTGALVAPGRLDARRCLSYLTIEHHGDLPEELRPALGRRVFGCDACQETCPHDRPRPADPAFQGPRAWLDLPALLVQDDDALDRALAGSPLRRARATGLKRNAAVVLGNLGDPAALPALEHALRHPAGLVRRHAAWAAAHCAGRALVETALSREEDPGTAKSMQRALAEPQTGWVITTT
ncbi:MAG: tRNA epoxyqueuosine(34) reductase QueG [Pseudomonadota bacterium]